MPSSHHGSNLRKGRYSIPGQIYLVTVVTYNRRIIFSDFTIGRIVIHEFMQADHFGSTRTQACVVMPDHFHWLFELCDCMSLTDVVANVKCHSARAINQRFVTTSTPVWQRGFHDHALRSEESVIGAARYIIANPLWAGLVKRVGDYPLWDAVWL
jgi:REP element-mobilizing transposase RayT